MRSERLGKRRRGRIGDKQRRKEERTFLSFKERVGKEIGNRRQKEGKGEEKGEKWGKAKEWEEKEKEGTWQKEQR